MPSHLRNGRDLSGEQRRRYVEAGVANPTGQRPVQRVERQSPVCQSGSDERPRSEPRSGSDTRQLQSDLLGLEVGDVYAGSFTGRPFNGTADGLASVGESGLPQQSRIHISDGLESNSDCRQSGVGDVYQHVPCSTEHVRRSSQDRRPHSHEGSSPPSRLEPRAHQSNVGPRPDDGSLRELASRSRSRHHGVSTESPSENGCQPGTNSLSGPKSFIGTNLASGERRDDLPGSYPSSSTGPRNLSGLVSPPVQSPAQTPEQNHAHLAVQNAMNASNYVGQNLTNVAANHAPYTNQMAMNMPAQNTLNYPAYTAQNAMNVQNPNSVPNYVAPSQQTHNQPMLEHPRPPQLQQGLPATSQQGGPTSNGRSNRRPNQRTRRDWFHYNRNDPPVHQPPHQQQRAAPYPVQHQPGGNLGRSRRRGRIPQQEDNTAQILEVGTFYLRAERVMGRIQRNERRNNIQRRNHPSQHNRQ
ncbi:hypothetical protein KEM48_003726 [Puccinia striiformis f. sp. tritici PST-130]|nr:hypothetical protein KEM48_003726 [Puccinia striiformis f. sp. tritici PST-130]